MIKRHLISTDLKTFNDQNLEKMVDCDFTTISCALPIVNEFDFLSFFVSIRRSIWNRSSAITAKSQRLFNL